MENQGDEGTEEYHPRDQVWDVAHTHKVHLQKFGNPPQVDHLLPHVVVNSVNDKALIDAEEKDDICGGVSRQKCFYEPLFPLLAALDLQQETGKNDGWRHQKVKCEDQAVLCFSLPSVLLEQEQDWEDAHDCLDRHCHNNLLAHNASEVADEAIMHPLFAQLKRPRGNLDN